MMNNKKWIALTLTLALCATLFLGCTLPQSGSLEQGSTPMQSAGNTRYAQTQAPTDAPTYNAQLQTAENAAPTDSISVGASGVTIPAGLCPICGDDDCDDGVYCDDAHELQENLREHDGILCTICGDDDCDDGIFCDDAHKHHKCN